MRIQITALAIAAYASVSALAAPPQWSASFGSFAHVQGVALLKDGAALVAYTSTPCEKVGSHEDDPSFHNKMAVAKVDSSGKTIFDVDVPRPREVMEKLRRGSTGLIDGVVAFDDGDFIVVAEFREGEPWLVRYDPAGAMRWAKSITTSEHRTITAVRPAGDDLVLAGTSGTDFLLARYSANGQKLWERVINAGGMDSLTDVALEPKGGIAAVGNSTPLSATATTPPQVIVFRFDKDGGQVAQRRFEGLDPTVAVSGDTIGVGYGLLLEDRQTVRFKAFDKTLAELAEVPFATLSGTEDVVSVKDGYLVVYAAGQQTRIAPLSARGTRAGDERIVDISYPHEFRAVGAGEILYLAFTDPLARENERICTKARLARIPLTPTSSNGEGIR
jgi:hypothetical protein